MKYNDKIERLEVAQDKMLKSFHEFANENNLDEDLRDEVIKILIEAVKEKRAEYYIEGKVSLVKESMNKVLSDSISKILNSDQDDFKQEEPTSNSLLSNLNWNL